MPTGLNCLKISCIQEPFQSTLIPTSCHGSVAEGALVDLAVVLGDLVDLVDLTVLIAFAGELLVVHSKRKTLSTSNIKNVDWCPLYIILEIFCCFILLAKK